MVLPHRTITIKLPIGNPGATKSLAAFDGMNGTIQSVLGKAAPFLGSMTVTPAAATNNGDGTMTKVIDVALGTTFFDRHPTTRSQIQALGSTVAPMLAKRLAVRVLSAVVS